MAPTHLVPGQRYTIRSLKLPEGYDENHVFPIHDAEFVRSYEHYGNTSHVFRWTVDHDRYVEWVHSCWQMVAVNLRVGEGWPCDIETHVYDHILQARPRLTPP